jgi:hypothetical protein
MRRSLFMKQLSRSFLGLGTLAILAACTATTEQTAPKESAESRSEEIVKGCSAGTRLCRVDPTIGSICCEAGENCVNGACVAPTTTRKGVIYPSQMVLGLMYRAPGNQSTVTYGSGSTFGTSWSAMNSYQYDGSWTVNAGISSGMGNGGSIGVSAGGNATVSGGFTSANSTTQGFSTTKTTTESVTLSSSQDELNHENDVFILWTNAEMVLTQTTSGTTVETSGYVQPIGGAPLAWLPVTVGELDGTVVSTNPDTVAFLGTLTEADKASLLGLDVLRDGPPTWFPNRFIALPTAVDVTGPDVGLSDTVTFQGQNTSTYSSQLTDTSYDGDSGGLSIAASVFSLGFTEGGKTTMNTVTSGTTTSGSTQSASATIKSSTLGLEAGYDVYYDTLFNSFAFVPESTHGASPCAQGAPAQLYDSHMAGCSGTVTYPNRATLCSKGSHVCNASEYTSNFGGAPPSYQYWTDDALGYGGTGSGACFAAEPGALGSYSCALNQPMRVCSGGKDPLGNVCNWTGCGFGAVGTNDFFGGCNADNTAGTLCCY